MKPTLTLFLFCALASVSYAKNPLAASLKKSDCVVCDKISEIRKKSEKHETAAAEDLAKYLYTLKFSKTPALHKKELKEVLDLSAKLIEKDEKYDIAQYMVSVKDEDPSLFAEVLKGMNEEDRKLIETWEAKMRKMFEKGEEAP